MDFLGISKPMLFLLVLLLIVLGVYCIHLYYKLDRKIDSNTDCIIEMLKKELYQPKPVNENKRIYYTTPSSLIEVSSDDNTTYDSEYECDNGDDDDDNYNSDDCEIKNVHMSLNLEDLGDIHVLLLDEIANINEINREKQCNINNEIKNNNEMKINNEMKNCLDEVKCEEMKCEEIKCQEIKCEEKREVEEMKCQEIKCEEKREVEEVKCEEMKCEEIKCEEKVEINLEEITETELSEPKDLTFKPKKRESRKNISSNDYKKMNLPDLRKYIAENNINLPDASKMKKPEILKAIEDLKHHNEGLVSSMNEHPNDEHEHSNNEHSNNEHPTTIENELP